MAYIQNTKIPAMTVYCDSLNCQSRNPFTYQLGSPIKCPLSVNMILSVENVTFANTFPNVTSRNNKLSFTINGTNTQVTFPIGLTSVFQFKNYFNSLSPDFRMIIDETGLRIRFVSSTPASIINDVDLGFETTCGELIGLPLNTANVTEFPVGANSSPIFTILMERGFNFTGGNYLFLKASNFNFSNIDGSGVMDETMLRIPKNANQGFIINYRPSEPIRMLVHRKEINSLAFSLVDQRGAVVTPDELQIVLKIDFVVVADQVDAGEGSIDYYFKKFGLPEDEDIEEESKQLGV